MQQSLSGYVSELRTTTASKERIESELSIAREIQMGMIPKIFPPYPEREDVDLHAILHPAKEVGGDLYDFFIDNDRLYFVIGDVSGQRCSGLTLHGHCTQPVPHPRPTGHLACRDYEQDEPFYLRKQRGQHVRYPHHRHTRPENRKPAFL